MSPNMEVVRCFGVEYNAEELSEAILKELKSREPQLKGWKVSPTAIEIFTFPFYIPVSLSRSPFHTVNRYNRIQMPLLTEQ